MVDKSGIILVRAHRDRRHMNDLLLMVAAELSTLTIVIGDGPTILIVSEPVTPGFCVVITR